MKILKRIVIVIAALVVILQFIRPPRNNAEAKSVNDITMKYSVPQDVRDILHTSCFDCHSNTTRYPWYAEIQPVGWFLNNDIQDAKRDLNFSEFAAYPARRQIAKFNGIVDQINEDEMPLPIYLTMHHDAKLTQAKKDRLIAWANAMIDTIKSIYPPDSLFRRR
jgi:hypothetical protein